MKRFLQLIKYVADIAKAITEGLTVTIDRWPDYPLDPVPGDKHKDVHQDADDVDYETVSKSEVQ